MATYLPQTENRFGQIHGVGSYKVKKYAKHFIPIIAKYCENSDNELISRVRQKSSKRDFKKNSKTY